MSLVYLFAQDKHGLMPAPHGCIVPVHEELTLFRLICKASLSCAFPYDSWVEAE